MRPQVPMSRLYAEYPRMRRWVDAMACHGGVGGPRVTYGPTFFRWMRSQILKVEDYAIMGIDFREDLELPIPYGEEWDDQGKKETIIHFFLLYF